MTATIAPRGTASGWLDRAATIAKPGFNRWLVPPAALAIHLCIGMSYGLSVFWLPLSKAIPGAAPAECKDIGVFGAATTTACNWRVSDLLVTFTIGIVVLGLSAALVSVSAPTSLALKAADAAGVRLIVTARRDQALQFEEGPL